MLVPSLDGVARLRRARFAFVVAAFAIAAPPPWAGAAESPAARPQVERDASAVEFEFAGATATARLGEGFHFNSEAPNDAEADGARAKPGSVDPREISFELPSSRFRALSFRLYVCDDANTFCEPRCYQLGRAAAGASPASPEAPEGAKVLALGSGFEALRRRPDAEAALARAKKARRPLLLEFSARWCPGCLRLEAESLSQAPVRRAMREFEALSFDYDRFETTPVREAYRVRAVPTLLAIDAEGREIARLIDYQPPNAVAAFLRGVSRRPEPLEKAAERARKGDAVSARRAGERLYAAGLFEESLPFFEKARPKPVEYWDARARAAQARAKADPTRSEEWTSALRDAIRAEPKRTVALRWRRELAARAETPQEERATLVQDGVSIADAWLANPARIPDALRGDNLGEFAGLERFYVADLRADLVEAGGDADKASEARRLAARVALDLRIPPSRRGPSLRVLIAHAAARDWAAVERLARAMLEAFPEDPEIERRLSRSLNQQGKHAEAIPFAERSRSRSYGLNEWWVAGELAKALQGAGREEEARALARSYLARSESGDAALASVRSDFERIANGERR